MKCAMSRRHAWGVIAVMFACGAVPYVFASNASEAETVISGCTSVGSKVPICGLRGSEDIEVMPGQQALLVSGTGIGRDGQGSFGWLPGNIVLLDLRTRQPTILYPGKLPVESSGKPAGSSGKAWGDPACPDEIAHRLRPHGIHLSERRDGHWQLLVVNHGARESVEIFEVRDPARHPVLVWRGCAVAPAESNLNDVAALPDGGFLVTSTAMGTGPGALMAATLKSEQGENTGVVWRWSAGKGYTRQPGGDSPAPNGIQVDADGRTMYLDIGGNGGGLRQVELETGRLLGFAPLSNPDNVVWAPNGSLLVTGGVEGKPPRCRGTKHFERACAAAFKVIAVNPLTMESRVVVEHEGPPMGGATVTVQADGYYYIGSYIGDRIMRMPVAER